MKRTIQIALVLLLAATAGCVSPIQQGWHNFTAYYNTFYNAQQYFSEGLELNRAQAISIDPDVLIRIHSSPTVGGAGQFAEAIERGASILRNHDQSRYVEPAILLIGQSYYYRSEFFSALETFQELQAVSSGENLKLSLIWQGRTYLEMESFSEGLRFLESESAAIEDWELHLEAELYALLAQFHAETGNLQTASEYLHFAAGRIENREMKGRAYFLHGQILEEQGFSAQALAAFRIASETRSDFDLQYHATRKQAEMARNVGDFDRSLTLFRSMIRNDNFIDYREELRYEEAFTYQQMGSSDEALRRYRRLLDDTFEPPTERTRTMAYYSMGVMYRDQLDDFPMAAAYFDSAASQSVDRSLLPQRMDITGMAESFGEYASLKREIALRDSLLHLGTLESDEFDRAIAAIQEQFALEAEQQRDERERTDRFLVADAEADTVIATDQTEHGFLNIQNRVLLTDASLQFQAVWGDRPLQDNWRRRAAVSGSRHDQIVLSDGETEISDETADDTGAAVAAGLDLSEIPMTLPEQEEMRMEREGYVYRLGNLFFLSFEMPDSARHYYLDVIESGLNPRNTERALYSLAELELTEGADEEAESLAIRLEEEFPESPYMARLSARFGRPQPLADASVSVTGRYSAIISSADRYDPVERAESLIYLAENHADERQKPILLFEAAQSYMQAARSEPEHSDRLDAWNREEAAADSARRAFEERRAEAMTRLEENGDLSEEEIEELTEIAEAEFEPAEREALFPFEGEEWDTVRELLQRIVDDYPDSDSARRAASMLETLTPPEDETEESRVVATMEFPEERYPREPAPEPAECREMGYRPDMSGGYEAFFGGINYPEWAHDAEFRGAVVYRITIGEGGEVTDYELVSAIDRSGIPQAIEEAIRETLRFTPDPDGGRAVCHLTVEIDLGR